MELVLFWAKLQMHVVEYTKNSIQNEGHSVEIYLKKSNLEIKC